MPWLNYYHPACEMQYTSALISVNMVTSCPLLTLFILDTRKQVLWQTVKTQMKGGTSSGSAVFAKIKTIFRVRNTSFYWNFDLQPFKIQKWSIPLYRIIQQNENG